ncbi:unnamed protein product [Mytilus edulis]|uniref:PiggyBac transposable element-derived protein domain-containing protein n=1 Tax=Mytilus edulis TaxID=6550 RepID=A0A8S3Q2K0_MYTED|nr:unnamed protein product [Mytilus edulis]
MAAIEPNPWFRVLPPELMNEPPFNGALTGPINMPPRDAAPIAYFYLLFSIDLIKEFVKQTNRYAKNLCNETIRQTRRFSRKKQWQKEGKLTIPEFKGFLAVFFNMGLIRKVSIEEYWNKHSPSQSTPCFRNILKFLHLVDTKKLPKRNDPAYRPSQRFKPLLDFVNRKFLRFYNPRRELSVDESLVGTKGKTSMLQYIPSKRSRFGVKFWMLVESVTGYVLQMDVYHGKRFDPTPAGTLQGTNVVMNLMKSSNLLGKGFHVFADSFFASLNLAKKLLRERTYLTGTMRKNRPMPQMIKNARPQAGNAVYSRQRQTMLCRFRDHNRKKPVTLVSTFYNAINTINGKPRVIGAYNTFMGGVDLSDQMIGATK